MAAHSQFDDSNIASMTGHGEAVLEVDGHCISVEIRSVNNRFLKVSTKISEGYYSLEPRIEDLVRRALHRGSVVVAVRIKRELTPDEFRINEGVLRSYCEQLRQLSDSNRAEAINPEALVMMPGVVEQRMMGDDETDVVWPLVQQAVNAALGELNQMRRREGEAMAVDLRHNRNLISTQLDQIRIRSPEVVVAYQKRISDRINALLEQHEAQVESKDIIREVGIFADRCDISEEIVRLTSHLDQFEKIMSENDSTGKKLDFLTQEMFRETNTIGSKANDAEIANHVVEIKTAIERMREMTQNIE